MTAREDSSEGHQDLSRTVELTRGRALTLGPLPAVMGIINVTPDSFSDGGVHLDPAAAIESALTMVESGASIIDVGGESTRPGAEPVAVDAELARVIPVIEGIRRRSEVAISIDTMKSAVAREAVAAGADILNDVTALRHDPELAPFAAEKNLPVILMHMRGEPRTMQTSIHYDDLLGEISAELAGWLELAEKAGIQRSRMFIDPGIGFGKTFEHNLEILARAGELRKIAPVVLGASRKAFIGNLTGRPNGASRMAGSLAAVAAAVQARASIVRVHDVAETVDFIKVFSAIRIPG